MPSELGSTKDPFVVRDDELWPFWPLRAFLFRMETSTYCIMSIWDTVVVKRIAKNITDRGREAICKPYRRPRLGGVLGMTGKAAAIC